MTCSCVKLGGWGIRSEMRESVLSFNIQSESTDLEALEG